MKELEIIDENQEEIEKKIDLSKALSVPDLIKMCPEHILPPSKPIEIFLEEFEYVRDAVETDEWQKTYSNFYSFSPFQMNIKVNETLEEIENYTEEQINREIIKCHKDFSYFCHKYVKISHPVRGLIPFITFDYQKKTIDCYEKHRFNMLSKFRQGGLTTVSVIWGLHQSMFKNDKKIMLVSKTDREAITAGSIANNVIDYLPSWMKPEMSKNNDHEKKFSETNSAMFFYTPEAARGKSISFIIIDEAAFIPDMDKQWKSIFPIISTGGKCAVVSTVNGVGNWYEETYSLAKSKKNNFNIIDIDFWEHPDYVNPSWVEQTLATLGDKGFKQEVLRIFLGSGETFFSSSLIMELDKKTKKTNPIFVKFEKYTNNNKNETYPFNDGALWIWKQPLKGREYIMGIDSSEGIGEEGDSSVIQILDSVTLEQVAEFCSNSIKTKDFSMVVSQLGLYYNNALAIVENLGPGTSVLNALQTICRYENIYYEELTKGNTQPGIKTKKDNRPFMINFLESKLVTGDLKINSRRFVSEMKTFIWNKHTKRGESVKGRHDDMIMAMALAMFVKSKENMNNPLGYQEEKKDLNSKTMFELEEIKREILAEEYERLKEETENDKNAMPIYFNINDQYKVSPSIAKEFGW